MIRIDVISIKRQRSLHVGMPKSCQPVAMRLSCQSQPPHSKIWCHSIFGVLQNMLHMPPLEVKSLHCVKYCSNSKLKCGLGHV